MESILSNDHAEPTIRGTAPSCIEITVGLPGVLPVHEMPNVEEISTGIETLYGTKMANSIALG